MEAFDILLRDPKFWTAVLFLIQTLLFLFLPSFPPQLWEAMSAVLVIVFGALTVRSTVQEKQVRARARQMKA
jgi:Mn2+/Fe2+ NRAMP family transporter